MSQADRILIPNDELHQWADFFVVAGLQSILTFEEFIREPVAIVASLCDLSAPLPKTLPVLHDRIVTQAKRRGRVVDLEAHRRMMVSRVEAAA